MLRVAWSVDARIAYQMCERFIQTKEISVIELESLIKSEPYRILNIDQCVIPFIKHANENQLRVNHYPFN